MVRKVVVVGGGAAGIAAASKLNATPGFEVTLLEAMDRIGGRIHTEIRDVNTGREILEKGAQWGHGESGITALMRSFGDQYLENDPIYPLVENWLGKTTTCTNDGKVINDETILAKLSDLGQILLEGPSDEDVAADPKCSVGDWFLKTIEADTMKDDKVMMAWLDFLNRLLINFDAADSWYESSIRGQHEYHHYPGCTHICWKTGFCTLLNILLNGNPEDFTIPTWVKLNSPVDHIDYGQSPTVIRTSDGKTYEADDVIVTASLGVLKAKHKDLFSPPLPEKKVKAIDGLGFGTVNKIHLKFEEKWWEDGWLGFHTLWIDDEAAKKFPKWCKNILGFYTYPGTPSYVMTVWLTGEDARLVETLPKSEVKDLLVEMIKTFLGRAQVPEPSMSMSTWFSNPYTRGSYSYRSPRSEEEDVWARDIEEPVSTDSGLLCFAGEATNSHYYSTVHGAYESGLREAERIVNRIQEN